MSRYFRGRVVVVSPHLDDAVLSLGAAIAAAVRRGSSVKVLTVFCGDPFSQTSAGPWDRDSGFASEGESSRARREEDRAACATLGASIQWLNFADEQYDRHGGEAEIIPQVLAATRGADEVLIPGWPLSNPDHGWLTQALLRKRIECGRLGLYVEQPYAFQLPGKAVPTISPKVQSKLKVAPTWCSLASSSRDRRLKRQAVSAYRSQVTQLGLGFIGVRRMLEYERTVGGEAVAWLPQGAPSAGHRGRTSSAAERPGSPGDRPGSAADLEHPAVP
jgi:LmbE family N-acetylglucosaminyl deacetylase